MIRAGSSRGQPGKPCMKMRSMPTEDMLAPLPDAIQLEKLSAPEYPDAALKLGDRTFNNEGSEIL